MRELLLASASFAVVFCGIAAAQDGQSFDRIDRGRYLSVLGDCAGCHTAPGGAPFAGGLVLQTPFGKLVAPNITPDRQTGIGNMSDGEFSAALQKGRGHNGKRLYPAMPYTAYVKMTADDVSAMRAYFRTVAPVSNAVESNQLPFPFNIRLSLVFWNLLNFKPVAFKPDPAKSAEWNRGAYIVRGPGHCGACHTPKNLIGGDKDDAPLQGALLQGWFAPNITPDERLGIGNWSKQDLVDYLKTGANKTTLASGPMSEAVTHSTSQMSDDDLNAIATYLKQSGITARGAAHSPLPANAPQLRLGAVIYKDNCAACHKDDGSGEPRLFPRLAGSALVQADDPTTVVHIALSGARAVSTAGAPTSPAMPAFDWRLDDAQIAAVVTYLRNTWGNAASAVSPETVADQRKSLAKTP